MQRRLAAEVLKTLESGWLVLEQEIRAAAVEAGGIQSSINYLIVKALPKCGDLKLTCLPNSRKQNG